MKNMVRDIKTKSEMQSNSLMNELPEFEFKPLRKALIMAGGFGTRMNALTKNMPKPMLPVQGKPILDYSIELCKKYGISEIAISIFHFGDQIKKHYGKGEVYGVNINYVEEPQAMGTAGALKLHKEWLDEDFMMCNADDLKDIDLNEMYEQHIKTGALATIALTRVEDPSKYGVVKMAGQRIVSFVEKPKLEDAPSNLVNSGLYIISPKVVEMVPVGFCMVEKNIFPKLAEMGLLFGFEFKGQWVDTGTEETYNAAQTIWKGFSEKKSVARAITVSAMKNLTYKSVKNKGDKNERT
jgi:mannose-1-phosphate guanylyltransferase